MENFEDNQESLNSGGDQDANLESGDDSAGEELAKAKEYAQNQKIRAEKAERELKALKGKTMETETPKKEEEQKSNEPDYAKLAFLETKGVLHPDDQKMVQEEANRLKLPLTDILGMEHIKSKLKTAKTQREAEDGMPSGTGKPSGAAKNTVDYWVDRKKADGSYDTPEDLELAEQVIQKRMRKEINASKFGPI